MGRRVRDETRRGAVSADTIFDKITGLEFRHVATDPNDAVTITN